MDFSHTEIGYPDLRFFSSADADGRDTDRRIPFDICREGDCFRPTRRHTVISVVYRGCTARVAVLGEGERVAYLFAPHAHAVDRGLVLRLCHRSDPHIGALVVASVSAAGLLGSLYRDGRIVPLLPSALGEALFALCLLGACRAGVLYPIAGSDLCVVYDEREACVRYRVGEIPFSEKL